MGRSDVKKVERQIDLIAFLLSQRMPVFLEVILSEIAGYSGREFDAARRMFFRDITDLAEDGIEIESATNPSTGETGFVINKEKYYLPQVHFEEDEARALSLLSVFLENQPLFPYREDLKSALMKIYFDLSFEDVPVDTLKKSLPFGLNLGEAPTEKLSVVLKQLEVAIRKKKTVVFTYHSLGARKTSRRQVDPYGLYYANGDWYLVGFCRTREGVRTFKLRRVKGEIGLKNKDKAQDDFTVPAGFSIEDYFRPMRWEYGEESLAVKVWFSSQLAGWAKQSLPEIQSVQDFPDGSAEVVFRVASTSVFLSWLLSLGEDALLIEPDFLKQALVEKLESIEGVYR